MALFNLLVSLAPAHASESCTEDPAASIPAWPSPVTQDAWLPEELLTEWKAIEEEAVTRLSAQATRRRCTDGRVLFEVKAPEGTRTATYWPETGRFEVTSSRNDFPSMRGRFEGGLATGSWEWRCTWGDAGAWCPWQAARVTGSFDKGRRSGTWSWTTEDFTIEAVYQDGVAQGDVKITTMGGSITTGRAVDGKRQGVWETRHASGERVETVRYEKGIVVE